MQHLFLNGKKAGRNIKKIFYSFLFFFTAKSGDTEANESCTEYLISPWAFINADI